MNVSDDILVHGSNETEHDNNLRAVFQRFRERGLTLNREKCLFKRKQLEFHGFVFSDNGMSPAPDKVRAVLEMATPKDASEVRSSLGMTNYSARFIKDYATITKPLRDLIKGEVSFQWSEEHQSAVDKLRDALKNATEMSYFDPDKNTEILTDASPVGLAAVFAQTSPNGKERHVIAYASKALTEA